jgi:ferredoxin
MCEFCTMHGEGEKWYLLMKNYSDELLHQELSPAEQAVAGTRNRLEWQLRSITDFVLPAAGVRPKKAKGKKRHPLAPAPVKGDIKKEIPDRQKFTHFGQVLPIEEVEKTVDLASSITRMPCGCRYQITGKENCRYCFGFGLEKLGMAGAVPDASTSLEVLTKDEAKTILRAFDKQGLMHSVWTGLSPFVIGVCNCDYDCGAYRGYLANRRKQVFFRAEYVCQSIWDVCSGCKACIRQCQFGAIFFSASMEKVFIDPARCYGCGVCRAACVKNAITLLPRESVPQAANIWGG